MEKVFAGQAVTNRERQNGGYEVGGGPGREMHRVTPANSNCLEMTDDDDDGW
jgi:hypothetical protein